MLCIRWPVQGSATTGSSTGTTHVQAVLTARTAVACRVCSVGNVRTHRAVVAGHGNGPREHHGLFGKGEQRGARPAGHERALGDLVVDEGGGPLKQADKQSKTHPSQSRVNAARTG